MNLFKRFFRIHRDRPDGPAEKAKSDPSTKFVRPAGADPEANPAMLDLCGPPEGDSPIVMVPSGKALLIMDRMSYEYREGLTKGTNPSQAELDVALAHVTRLRVLSGGMMRDKALGVEVLLDTRDVADIAAFRTALRIEENQERGGHCACLGSPTVECYAGRSLVATLSFHHGLGMRWYSWKHDARLADHARLIAWLKRHGIDADKDSEDPMQFGLLAMGDAERLAHRAHSHLVRGELNQALEDCGKALSSDQECALAYGVRALIYRTEERAADCERDCDAAIRLGLKHPEVFLCRAAARDARGDATGAEADSDAALALAPDNPAGYNSRGLIRSRLGRTPEALADFAKAIELAPDWPLPLANRAGLHERTEEWPQAVADYSTAIRLIEAVRDDAAGSESRGGYPLSFHYSRRGWAHFAMQDKEAAEADFEQAVNVDPEDPQALLGRAGFAFLTGQCETALSDCTQAIELRPDHVEAYLARAQIWTALSEPDQALADLNEALRWSPDHTGALLQRGQLFMGMDRHREALRDFDAMIRLQPEHAIGYYLRSLYWRTLDDHHRQRDDLEQAVRIAPDWSDACNWLSWLLATCPEASIRDGARAVEFGRRALEHSSDPGRPGCLDTLAAALAENGDFDEALDRQREAISLIDDIDRRLSFERRILLYESRQPYREGLDD